VRGAVVVVEVLLCDEINGVFGCLQSLVYCVCESEPDEVLSFTA